jgi:uncharacterized protein YaeQ
VRYSARVALTATIYNFAIDLADSDRGVYETLALRVARHPSESEEYLVTRVLAYCLQYTDGIEFSSGISDPDVPAVAVRDLTGTIRVWIDIGLPDPDRLHKASKASARVIVYTHKDPAQWLRQLASARIHRAETIEIYGVDRDLVAAMVGRLTRRMGFGLSVTDQHLLIATDDDTVEGSVTRHTLAVSR